MLPFPPVQLDAPVTVFPSLITSPSIVQHLSPAPPSRGPRIRTVVLNQPPHPFLQLEQALKMAWSLHGMNHMMRRLADSRPGGPRHAARRLLVWCLLAWRCGRAAAWPRQCKLDSGRRPTCKARSRHKTSASLRLSIAVYTYTIGGRQAKMPLELVADCRPDETQHGVHCFYFVTSLEDTFTHSWVAKGWRMRELQMGPGSELVSPKRLTAKFYKFVLPPELLKYDWVLSLDDNYSIDLDGLPPLVDVHAKSALVMLDWKHYTAGNLARTTGDSGFKAFSSEARSMLRHRPGYIGKTYLQSKEWLKQMQDLYSKEKKTGLFRTYYDGSILLQHVSHAQWKYVRLAFKNVYEASSNIERDQFLLPYHLWKVPEAFNATAVVNASQLFDRLCRCVRWGDRHSSERLINNSVAPGFECAEDINFTGQCAVEISDACPTLMPTARHCQDLCASTPGCEAITYNSIHECYLKADRYNMVRERVQWSVTSTDTRLHTLGCRRHAPRRHEHNAKSAGDA